MEGANAIQKIRTECKRLNFKSVTTQRKNISQIASPKINWSTRKPVFVVSSYAYGLGRRVQRSSTARQTPRCLSVVRCWLSHSFETYLHGALFGFCFKHQTKVCPSMFAKISRKNSNDYWDTKKFLILNLSASAALHAQSVFHQNVRLNCIYLSSVIC